jgi:citrate synthase
MLDARGSTAYRPDPRLVAALETLLVLHAEHEMDCCTAAVCHLASRWDTLRQMLGGCDPRECIAAGAAC